MQNEEKRDNEGLASSWGFRLWLGLLACLALVWIGWWGYARFVLRKAPRVLHIQGKDGSVKKLVWKRPQYKKFARFADVIQAAQKAKKPIFLDLYADWCTPCKKLEKQTFSHPTIHPILSKYIVVKFNIDQPEGRRLSRLFRVRFYPTTLMLNSSGGEVERVVGFYPARYYRPAVASVVERKNGYTQLKQRIQKEPNNLRLALKLANRSILRKEIPQARRLFKRVWEADKDNKNSFGAWGLFGYARSFSRISQYASAIPHLETFHRLYPKRTDAQREVLRLQIYCYKRTRKSQAYRRSIKMFRRNFPGLSEKFK